MSDHRVTGRTAWLRSTVLFAMLFVCVVIPVRAERAIEGDPSDKTYPAQPIGVDSSRRTADAVDPGGEPVVGVLPYVRLTPRDVAVAGHPISRIDLNGAWDFVRDVPEGFDGGAASVPAWGTVNVPGHPALQGYEKMHKEMGVPFAYHRAFTVPGDWRGNRVVLRFEGIDGLTKLWINGQPAGQNEIATLPSEYDITRFVKFGEQNELLLTIEKTLTTYWSRRELGGINRPVYLQALPDVNLARLHVDTDLSRDLSHATVNARLRIANQSGKVAGPMSVRFRLVDRAGREVPLKKIDTPVALTDIQPGQMLDATVPLPVIGTPRLWTAETPDLYTLECELLVDGEPVMSARQRFGFREVRVQGHEILVNASPVKLRGTNYHITFPGLGEAVPTELIRRDIELFKRANFNCLRSRPTPSYDYVELCDEMGIYTTVEAMVSIMMYDKGPLGDHGNNPSMAEAYRHHVATMIESYYSNPSVITWGLGNECSYWDYFKVAAIGMHTRDTTRPLFFGSDGREGVDIAFMDINDDHYPRAHHSAKKPYASSDPDHLGPVTDPAWEYPDDRPNIFTEWLHIHTNNHKEIAFDPGIDDLWGYYALIHIETLYQTPHFAGGFHFKGAPYRGIGVDFPWRGVFDEERRINDIYWHVKKSHSPVRIADTVGQRDGDVIVFRVENRYDFTNLGQITFTWSRGEAGGTISADVPPHQRGELRLPAEAFGTEPTRLDAHGPSGELVDQYLLTVEAPSPGPADTPAPDNRPFVLEEHENHYVLTRGAVRYDVNKATGMIASASVEGRLVIQGPVTLAVIPTQLHNFKWQAERTLVNQCTGWKARTVSVENSGDTVRIRAEGAYTLAGATFVTSFHADGRVEVSYDAVWTGEQPFNIFTIGLQLPIAPAFDTLYWERDALWSYYPQDHIGRPAGEAPAEGEPRYAESRAAYTEGPKPWPWSQDLISGVTRDFRSTKFNLIRGGLHDQAGRGIEVIPQGRQHMQAVPARDDLGGELKLPETSDGPTDGFELRIHHFHNGGTEPHLTKSIRFEEQIAAPGWTTQGVAVFRLTE